MLRNILAVICGYFAMAIFVMLGFSLAFVAPDFAFQNNSFEVTSAWVVYSLVISLIGAALGGLATARIAALPGFRTVMILAGLVVVLGFASAVGNSLREPPAAEKYPSEEIAKMTMMERASHAVQPTWYAFTLPIVGTVGVVVGGLGLSRRASG